MVHVCVDSLQAGNRQAGNRQVIIERLYDIGGAVRIIVLCALRGMRGR